MLKTKETPGEDIIVEKENVTVPADTQVEAYLISDTPVPETRRVPFAENTLQPGPEGEREKMDGTDENEL